MKIINTIESDNKAKVLSVFTDETNVIDVDIQNIPTPNAPLGKYPQLYINLENNELFYEYLDIPLSDAEELLMSRLVESENKNAILEQSILELSMLLGGM